MPTLTGVDIPAIVDDWLRQARRCGHRQLLLISGDQAWGRERALRIVEACAFDRQLLLSDRNLGQLEPVEARHILGTESDLVVVDCWGGFDLNALAAAAGTLCAGGLMLWLTPDWESWPLLEKGNRAPSPTDSSERQGRESLFLRRLIGILRDDDFLAVISERDGLRRPQGRRVQVSASALPSADQLTAIEAVRRVALGHRRRPLVLRADRGRGKSAALGLAAASLMAECEREIIVTAPRPVAVETLFAHAAETLPGGRRSGLTLRHDGSRLIFVPPDQLLREKPAAGLLLVDEAAAIPVALLEALLELYPRVVFATTVHGYEGSGRGFDVRFSESLERLTPHWRQLSLQTPIRWRQGDPLEQLLFRALALDAEPIADAGLDNVFAQELQPQALKRWELLNDETSLLQLFGLLVVAHYQTSPEDLRLLLDNPSVRVFVMHCSAGIAAAALVMEEGGLEEDIGAAVATGVRRLKGQLLPQSLAFHCGFEEAVSLRAGRIIRIAVHPRLRQQGVGSRLLFHIEATLSAEGIDFLGSSFAADDRVTPFWLHAEYSPLRMGSRRDTCSGNHSLLMAKPLSEPGLELLERVQARFSRQFPVLLGDQLRLLPATLVQQLLSASLPGEVQVDHEVMRYATGVSQYEHVEAALWCFCSEQLRGARLRSDYFRALILRVLQRRSWADTAYQLGVKGRADVDKLLRDAFRELLM